MCHVISQVNNFNTVNVVHVISLILNLNLTMHASLYATMQVCMQQCKARGGRGGGTGGWRRRYRKHKPKMHTTPPPAPVVRTYPLEATRQTVANFIENLNTLKENGAAMLYKIKHTTMLGAEFTQMRDTLKMQLMSLTM